MTTFERLMPSIILSKAASTPVEGATGVELAFGRCDAAPVPVDFPVGFGVGEGFGSTVRVRVVVVEEFEFCADANMALNETIEAMTRNLLNMIGSSTLPQSHRDAEINKGRRSLAIPSIAPSVLSLNSSPCLSG